MSLKNKYSAGEGWSSDLAGEWGVQSSLTAGTSDDVTNTAHLSLNGGIMQLGLYSASDFYFSFNSDGGDINTSNDLICPGGTLMFIRVPRGVSGAISFNALAVSASSSTSVRVVTI